MWKSIWFTNVPFASEENVGDLLQIFAVDLCQPKFVSHPLLVQSLQTFLSQGRQEPLFNSFQMVAHYQSFQVMPNGIGNSIVPCSRVLGDGRWTAVRVVSLDITGGPNWVLVSKYEPRLMKLWVPSASQKLLKSPRRTEGYINTLPRRSVIH